MENSSKITDIHQVYSSIEVSHDDYIKYQEECETETVSYDQFVRNIFDDCIENGGTEADAIEIANAAIS